MISAPPSPYAQGEFPLLISNPFVTQKMILAIHILCCFDSVTFYAICRSGEYLALTGDKLNGVEMIACRLATHYSLNARLALLEERLGKLITDEPSVVETSLAQYGDLVYPDRSSVLHRIDNIDRCFGHETVEEIIEALEKEAAESCDEWCSTTLRRIREASPLSLKIREGRFETLDKCLIREYRMSLRGISKHVSSDFFEGVRARMVDKDFAPKWDPPSLKEISEDMVEYYLSPLSEVQSELVLPTALREPYIYLENPALSYTEHESGARI
ncbi:3-hydroxyisobutyryl-CoA hydrolase-like protein 2, mitochondrial, partial [Mucuna pruriens]